MADANRVLVSVNQCMSKGWAGAQSQCMTLSFKKQPNML